MFFRYNMNNYVSKYTEYYIYAGYCPFTMIEIRHLFFLQEKIADYAIKIQKDKTLVPVLLGYYKQIDPLLVNFMKIYESGYEASFYSYLIAFNFKKFLKNFKQDYFQIIKYV